MKKGVLSVTEKTNPNKANFSTRKGVEKRADVRRRRTDDRIFSPPIYWGVVTGGNGKQMKDNGGQRKDEKR